MFARMINISSARRAHTVRTARRELPHRAAPEPLLEKRRTEEDEEKK